MTLPTCCNCNSTKLACKLASHDVYCEDCKALQPEWARQAGLLDDLANDPHYN